MAHSERFPNGTSPKPSGWLALAIYALLILSPNFVTLTDLTTRYDQYWFAFVANFLFILLILFISTKPVCGIIVLAPVSILAMFELLYVMNYGRASDAHLLGVLAETNPEEVHSYLTGLKLPVAVLICCALLITTGLAHLSSKQNWRWDRGHRRIIIVGGFLGLMLLLVPDWLTSTDPQNPFDQDSFLMGPEQSIASNQLNDSFPLGIPFRINTYYKYRQGLHDAIRSIDDFRFGAVKASEINQREIYVLVIGETGRPDRWSLNGYERETTPHLSAKEGVISMTNIISPWAWTRMSVPLILTRKPEHDRRAFFAEKSLITAFREAGYQTYWLSTQSPLGLHDSSTAFHAHEAHHVRFLNPIDYKGKGEYDGVMLESVRDIVSKDESRQLIVLHTLGSHFNYAHRYPPEFDIFQPSHRNNPNASMHDISQRVELNNSYDNSILYTDFFLAALIDLLDSTDALSAMYYVADHGENLFDGECEKSGHGHATEYDFRVASAWWSSEQYREAFPEKVSFLSDRRNEPATTSHVFHTLLDAADIRFEGEDVTRSLASPSWTPRPRWTQTGFFFDSAERESSCKTLISDRFRY